MCNPCERLSLPLPSPAVPALLDGYTSTTFTADDKTRDIYQRGSGPAVIVISEMPGITPLVAAFGRRVAELGCTAVLPQLFGEPGRPPSAAYALQTMASVCMSREFSMLATRRTSPVTRWLRALAAHCHAECGGPGVGAVGMCLTGGFALAMMVDDVVVAPVLSQPSLPVALPFSSSARRDLGISSEDLARVKQRVAEGVCVLGLRFTDDLLVPAERFARLTEELGDGFVAVELGSDANPPGVRHPHSVLTEHLVDEPGHPTQQALEQVLELFRTRLLVSPGA